MPFMGVIAKSAAYVVRVVTSNNSCDHCIHLQVMEFKLGITGARRKMEGENCSTIAAVPIPDLSSQRRDFVRGLRDFRGRLRQHEQGDGGRGGVL